MLSSALRFGVLGVAAAAASQRQAGPHDLHALAVHAVAAADAYVEAAGLASSVSQVASDMEKQDAEAVASLEDSEEVQEQQLLDDDLSAGGRCPPCSRDYRRACPASWTSSGGGACEASAGYSGACPAVGFFSEMSALDKKEFEHRCSACWPCVGSGGGAVNARGPASLRGGAGAAAAFLQAAQGAAPEVASVRLVEPGGRALKAATALRRGVADALAALEARQESDDALFASLLASSQALAREAATYAKKG